MCTRLYIQILSTHVLYHASYEKENTFLHLFYIRGFVFTVVFNHRKYKNKNEILGMFSNVLCVHICMHTAKIGTCSFNNLLAFLTVFDAIFLLLKYVKLQQLRNREINFE